MSEKQIVSRIVANQNAVMAGQIIEEVCAAFEISKSELLARARTAFHVKPRQVAMYLIRRNCGLSSPKTGLLLYRDHTTVLHGVATIEQKILEDRDLKEQIEAILEKAMARATSRAECKDALPEAH